MVIFSKQKIYDPKIFITIKECKLNFIRYFYYFISYTEKTVLSNEQKYFVSI